MIGEVGDSTFVRVESPDRVGLLAGICRWFADHGLSIEAADVSTVDGIARDVFLVTGEFDVDALSAHLGRPRGGALTRVARAVGIAESRPSASRPAATTASG